MRRSEEGGSIGLRQLELGNEGIREDPEGEVGADCRVLRRGVELALGMRMLGAWSWYGGGGSAEAEA